MWTGLLKIFYHRHHGYLLFTWRLLYRAKSFCWWRTYSQTCQVIITPSQVILDRIVLSEVLREDDSWVLWLCRIGESSISQCDIVVTPCTVRPIVNRFWYITKSMLWRSLCNHATWSEQIGLEGELGRLMTHDASVCMVHIRISTCAVGSVPQIS